MNASPAPSTLKTSTGKPGTSDPSLRLVRNRRREGDAALRPELADQQRVGPCANRPERAIVSVAAAEDADLLLGADDQVAERQDLLQALGHRVDCDEAVLAQVLAGQAPEHRAIVDIEHDFAARLPWRCRAAFIDASKTVAVERCVPLMRTAPPTR